MGKIDKKIIKKEEMDIIYDFQRILKNNPMLKYISIQLGEKTKYSTERFKKLESSIKAHMKYEAFANAKRMARLGLYDAMAYYLDDAEYISAEELGVRVNSSIRKKIYDLCNGNND